jgi:hypothetical protein
MNSEFKVYEVGMTVAQFEALRTALLYGAMAERQRTLCTLIRSNHGTQLADSYERELNALRYATQAVIDAKAR